MTLRSRILVPFVGVFLAAVVILTQISYVRSRDAVQESMALRLDQLAREVLASVEATLEMFQSVLGSIHVLPSISDHVAADDAQGVLGAALQRMASNDLLVGPVDFLEPGGRVVASNLPGRRGQILTAAELARSARGGLGETFALMPVGTEGQLGLRLVLPVPASGSAGGIAGYVVGYLNWARITRILDEIRADEPSRGNRTTEIFLLDGAGRALAASLSDSPGADLTSTRSFLKATAGTRSLGVEVLPDGHEVLVARVGTASRWMPSHWSCRVQQATSESFAKTGSILRETFTAAALVLLVLGTLGSFALRRLVSPIKDYVEFANRLGAGDMSQALVVEGQGDLQTLGRTLEEMRRRMATTREELEQRVAERTAEAEARATKLEEQDWLKSNLNTILQELQGIEDPAVAAQTTLRQLVPQVHGCIGSLFLKEQFLSETAEADSFVRFAGYAIDDPVIGGRRFREGQGLVGQAIKEKLSVHLKGLPREYVTVRSGIGEASPQYLLVVPITHEGAAIGALEIGSMTEFTPSERWLIDAICQQLGIVIENIASRSRMSRLLDRVGQQNEELQSAKQTLENQATKLADASRYKSEFLANMSHELRTPLNSIMMLSDLLGENASGRLTAEELQWSRSIHSSGRDLLELISDILDVSKIEAGRMDVHLENVDLRTVIASMRSLFDPVARQRGLEFNVELEPGVPAGLRTDERRFGQILKNLLSNAFKFTEKGRITMRLAVERRAADAESGGHPVSRLLCSVADTGIGIPRDKQERIFEPFTQADGSTSRRFGGTGLGMSISRRFAHMLGGTLTLESTPGVGSIFTVMLPLDLEFESTRPHAREETSVISRAHARSTVVILESDRSLADEIARRLRPLDFEVVLAATASEGRRRIHEHRPASIVLGEVPDGTDLGEMVKDLRSRTYLGTVPLHVLGDRDRAPAVFESPEVHVHARSRAAPDLAALVGVIQFAEVWRARRLLVAGTERTSGAVERSRQAGIAVDVAASLEDAVAHLMRERYDLVLVEAELVGGDERPFAQSLAEGFGPGAPVLEVARSEPSSLPRLESLLTGLVPRAAPKLSGNGLKGRRVLLVDDDPRNIEAMQVRLSRLGMSVTTAENGAVALDRLKECARSPDSSVELVLLDLMMPVMDGFQTLDRIGRDPELAQVPVIVLTAKAMPGDRETCLAAGARGYLSKPVDVNNLIGAMTAVLEPVPPPV